MSNMYKMRKISDKPLTDEDLQGFDAAGIVLPGFVENGVTYKSHTFTVHFGRRNGGIVYWKEGEDKVERVQEAIIRVRHGGGHEAWRVSHMLAVALDGMLKAGLEREAFYMCWAAAEIYRDCIQYGLQMKKGELYKAFVEGRLKKRKTRGSNGHTVWILPEKPLLQNQNFG